MARGRVSLIAASAMVGVLSVPALAGGRADGAVRSASAAVPCTLADGLKAKMRGDGAAAGTAYFKITYVNAGTSSCTLSGYPGVQPVDGSRHLREGPSSMHITDVRGRGGIVLLKARGGRADTYFGLETAQNYPAQRCDLHGTDGLLMHFSGVPAFFVKGPWRVPSDGDVCTKLQSTNTDGVGSGDLSAP